MDNKSTTQSKQVVMYNNHWVVGPSLENNITPEVRGMDPVKKTKGTILVLITAIVSGFSIFLNSFAVKGFDSSVFTFSKNIVVAAMIFAVILGCRRLKELKSLSRKQWLQLSLIGLVGGSIPFLLYFKGLQLATGATSAFIHKSMFVFIAVMAVFFLKEKLTKWTIAAAGLLMVGNFLVLRPNFSVSTGTLFILAATLLWAVESVYSKHVLKQVSGTVVAFGRMFFGSLFIFAFLAATGKAGIVLSMNPAQYGWIAVTSLLLLAYVFTFYNGLKHIKATTAACILTLGSPITTALTLLQGKVISPFEIVGSIFIAAAVISLLFASKSEASWTAFASQ